MIVVQFELSFSYHPDLLESYIISQGVPHNLRCRFDRVFKEFILNEASSVSEGQNVLGLKPILYLLFRFTCLLLLYVTLFEHDHQVCS